MGSFTPHRGTHRFISVSERTTHPAHGHLPFTGAHNVPSPSQRGTTHPSHGHTQLMGFLTPHRGTQRSISVSERNYTPISWAHPTHGLPHPTQGHTTFHLRLREEQHTHLMGTPNSWALSQADSLSLCPGGCLTQL
jgi:hypothetical protein